MLRLVRREGESADEWQRKRLVLPPTLLLIIVWCPLAANAAINTAAWSARGGGDARGDGKAVLDMGMVGTWYSLLCAAALFGAVLVTRRLSLRAIEVWLSQRTEGQREPSPRPLPPRQRVGAGVGGGELRARCTGAESQGRRLVAQGEL
eukprot:gene54395-27074_t